MATLTLAPVPFAVYLPDLPTSISMSESIVRTFLFSTWMMANTLAGVSACNVEISVLGSCLFQLCVCLSTCDVAAAYGEVLGCLLSSPLTRLK